ncbi:MAG: hypothetical protein EAX95_05320 [Candidatus Thorarchaeota archaeon]|nr:hypothetical protein [Candidatus Thorarchaeota archaeon]
MSLNEPAGELVPPANLLPSEISTHVMKDAEIQTSVGLVNPVIEPINVVARTPFHYGVFLRIMVGLAAAILLLVPLASLPGLIVAVLPLEIYVIGLVYDGVLMVRSKNEDRSEVPEIEKATEECEKGRVRVYGARLLP